MQSDTLSRYNGDGPVSVTGGASAHVTMGANSTYQQAGGVTYTFSSVGFTTIFGGSAGASLILSPSISFGGSVSSGQAYAMDGLSILYKNGNSLLGSTGAVTNGALSI